MCGIFGSIWHDNKHYDSIDYDRCKCTIERRGPDYFGEHFEDLPNGWKGVFASSILWMQGQQLAPQPCIDADGNILLWNGDIFSGQLTGSDASDTEMLSNALQTSQNVEETLRIVKGPYSIVYYKKSTQTLYFARDPIGRHSLLLRADPNCNKITLSSVASGCVDDFVEVPAVGIFAFVIGNSEFRVYPWFPIDSRTDGFIKNLETLLKFKIDVFDPIYKQKRILSNCEPRAQDIQCFDRIASSISPVTGDPEFDVPKKVIDTARPEILRGLMKKLSEVPEIRQRIKRVLQLLRTSVKVRVEKKTNFCQNCIRLVVDGRTLVCNHPKVGILFSGGLDSTLLAALADEFVSKNESIDLVNVAFEKVNKFDSGASMKDSRKSMSVAIFDVPDRKTGREALRELQRICPSRTWNFVECNITREELKKYRSSTIRDLVYPRSTILDDSLGCALWFASRASGTLLTTGERYDSPIRVLLVGMGADELFGGYTRHRTILRRSGWLAVQRELEVDLGRISERNLGRDDRVVADHGRQSRLPYLDEDFVEYVSSLNAWERCQLTDAMPSGFGDKLLLRLAAYEVGLHQTANFPKRAFQFGSRIANSKQNATEVSQWE